ncbi:TPA: hypothetical protein F6V70_23915 [Escherichia coli]|nr:hypothetical protein [Escherichia coli]
MQTGTAKIPSTISTQILDDYKLGAISQQQAVGGITSLVDAIEISDSGKISLMLSEGRKLLRTG